MPNFTWLFIIGVFAAARRIAREGFETLSTEVDIEDGKEWSLKVDFGLDSNAKLAPDRGVQSGNVAARNVKYVPMPGFERMNLSPEDKPSTQRLLTQSGVEVSLSGFQWAWRYEKTRNPLFAEAAVCWDDCNMTLSLNGVPPGDYTMTLYHVVPQQFCGKCFPVEVTTEDGTVRRWTRSHHKGNGGKKKEVEWANGLASKTVARLSVGEDKHIDVTMLHNGKGQVAGDNMHDRNFCSHCMGCARCGYDNGHMAINGLELERSKPLRVRPYNEADAKVYSNYAQATFCDQDAVETWDCGPSCDAVPRPLSVRYLGPGDQYKVVGYVALIRARHCVVAFRGSTVFENWLANLYLVPRKWPDNEHCPGCKTHSGLGKAYQELEEPMFRAFEELGCETVGVTGHSLGGGVGALASFSIRTKSNLHVFPVYLFGAPRIGNPAWVRAYTRAAHEQGVFPPAWRVVHWKDPVPHLFPYEETCKYEHFHREIFYTENFTSYTECSMDVYEDQSCAFQFPLGETLKHSMQHTMVFDANFAHEFADARCIAPKKGKGGKGCKGKEGKGGKGCKGKKGKGGKGKEGKGGKGKEGKDGK